MKLDALVVAAHPDDAEISLGGTMLKLIRSGAKVGVLDLTRGEMGTRGSQADRDRESAAATRALGLAWRGNLGLADARVDPTLEAREELARILRERAPGLLFAQHTSDLHPDHAACGRLARDAWYLAGLSRLAAERGGPAAHRPRSLFHYMGHVPFEPTLVVDVSDVWEAKEAVIRCYASQLAPRDSQDQGTHLLFGADVLERARIRGRYFGERIGARYGEPLLHLGPLGVQDAGRLFRD